MALVVKDRVQESSTTTGTGTLTLGGALTGFQTFSSSIGNGNTTYYTIQGNGEWEVGIGTVSAGALSRDTVLESSNGGSLVNFSVGTKNVFCTYPAEKSVDSETAQTLTNKTISADNNTLSGIAASSFVLSNASGNIDGSAPQKAIPSGVVVGTTDSQTLTNKTLTNPTVNGFTGDTSVINVGSGQIYKNTSGNVGIGTSSPITKLNISGSSGFSGELGTLAVTGNTTAKRLAFGVDSTSTMYGWIQSVENGIAPRDLVLQGLGGNVLINQTSQAGSSGVFAVANTAGSGGVIWATSTNNSTYYPAIFKNSSNSNVGNINCTASATAYVTSSDYRLKENIQPMVGALDTVAQLKPVTYKWKIDGSDGQGFIAHELQEVVPDCVIGEKDAVNEDGSIKAQGIDTSFLVATLTAAIQEQQAIITDIKNQLDEVKAELQTLKNLA